MDKAVHVFDEQFATLYAQAVQLCKMTSADALVLLLEGPANWEKLKKRASKQKIVIVGDSKKEVEGALEQGLETVILDMTATPIYEKLSHALLTCVADEILDPGSSVVALYSGFEPESIDTISYIQLDDHLGRLTARDLRQLGTRVPLDTLKVVVDLAVEIGREGREGKPVGTMLVVGDAKESAGGQPARRIRSRERV